MVFQCYIVEYATISDYAAPGFVLPPELSYLISKIDVFKYTFLYQYAPLYKLALHHQLMKRSEIILRIVEATPTICYPQQLCMGLLILC
jgi:hypothetical protein